jgi:hypothetical protein
MDWVDMREDRARWFAIVNVVMNLGSTKCREFLDKLRISYNWLVGFNLGTSH